MSCRNRSVCCEDAGCSNLLRGFRELIALLNEFTRSFQQHECSVAFISVKDSRLNAQGAQNTHASDAKYNLLSNPMFLVAAVKACGEFPVPMLVFFNIGVHQVERYGTEADAPDDNEYAETANLQLNKESLFGVGAG